MEMNRRDFFKTATLGLIAPPLLLASCRNLTRSQGDRALFTPLASDGGRNLTGFHGNEALVAGYPVSWWEQNYGLPLHVHYGPVIAENARAFQDVFKRLYPKGEIRFAAKANAHPTVFRILIKEGLGIDVASMNETKCALLSQADPTHLDVNGNVKTKELIELAIGKDMVIISDGPEEFRLIAECARTAGIKPRVMQRLAGFELGKVTDSSCFTAGKWTKFGMDIKELDHFFTILDRTPEVDFQGFHVHIGSQITLLEAYQTVAGKMVEFSKALINRGRPCKILNLGGGFPYSYVNREQWDEILERIRKGYTLAIKGDSSQLWAWDNNMVGFRDDETGQVDLSTWKGESFYSKYPKEKMLEALLAGPIPVDGKSIPFTKAMEEIGSPTLVIEPGRSMTEDSGVTLSRVGHVRTIGGGHNLIALEAGVVSFAEAMEVTIPMNRWSLATGTDRKDPDPFDAFIAGNLCYTGDMPSKYKIQFPRKPVRGDVLITHDTGAYNPHFYVANTNAFPRPSRVIVNGDGSVEYIKIADTFDEIFSLNDNVKYLSLF